MKAILIACSFLISTFSVSLEQSAWMKVSGKWYIDTSEEKPFLSDKFSKSYAFGYSDLINNNTLISLAPYQYNKVFCTMEITSSVSKENNFTLIYNMTDPSFRSFFAVRFCADKKKIRKIVLLQSQINDANLHPKIKNNFTVTELTAKKCSIPFSEKINVEVDLTGDNLIVSVNSKKIVEYEQKLPAEKSKFGFYHTNNLVKVYSFKAYLDDTEVFADDFSTDRIKRNTVKATVTPK